MADQLLSPIQQRFFFAVMEGKSAAEAFKIAKFPTGVGNMKKGTITKGASRMLNSAAVVQALARARAKVAARNEITVDDLVSRLEHVYQIALTKCDPPQTSGAVAATLGIAKLLGLVVDRKEVAVLHKPAISNKQLELGEDEWRRQFDRPNPKVNTTDSSVAPKPLK
jgi:hypothetical protein